MKDKFKILLVLLLFIPFIIYADTYNEAEKKINNYMKSITYNDSYKLFLYENKRGFISSNEYELVKSYIDNGYSFWLKDNNKSIESNNVYTRDTEYVLNDAYVSGKGTYNNPWTFSMYYNVNIETDGNGKISLNKESTYENNISFNYYGGEKKVYINPSNGYMYKSNTCSFKQQDNYLIVENIKSNKNCKVEFEFSKINVTFEPNGGNVLLDSKEVTYNSTYGELPIATRDEYKFIGWYTEISDGTEVTSDTTVTNKSDHTLYARWKKLYLAEYEYTGDEQIYTIPEAGTYKIEVYGAQGGNANTYSGGLGGYSYGNFTFKSGDTLHIYVGGKGEDGGKINNVSGCQLNNDDYYYTSIGGYNGGAKGHGYNYNCIEYGEGTTYAGAGGGATHVALSSGLLSKLSKNKSEILIVAGGGGGAIYSTDQPNTANGNGGSGGGGNNSGGKGSYDAKGGTLEEGAYFGKGGIGTRSYAGGGAGYYGGYSTQGEKGIGSAGGGSGYIKNTATNPGGENGKRMGNGYVRISQIN